MKCSTWIWTEWFQVWFNVESGTLRYGEMITDSEGKKNYKHA